MRISDWSSDVCSSDLAAIDRTIAALAVCSDKLRHRRVTLARSVATEACRRAANGAEFIARVAAETGIMLDVISPEEEARLAALGRSEEHTSELQSLMRISYAVFCLKKKKKLK